MDFKSVIFTQSYRDEPNHKNILTVGDGHHTEKIEIVGIYHDSNFGFASDGAHGLLITFV